MEEVAAALAGAWRIHPTQSALREAYAEKLLALGVLLQGQERLDEAVEVTKASIMVRPDSASAHYNTGLLLLKQHRQLPWHQRRGGQQLEAPLAALLSATHIQPDHGDAHYHIANTHRAAGRADAALAAYAKGVVAAPWHHGLRSSLGFALLSTRKAVHLSLIHI